MTEEQLENGTQKIMNFIQMFKTNQLNNLQLQVKILKYIIKKIKNMKKIKLKIKYFQ